MTRIADWAAESLPAVCGPRRPGGSESFRKSRTVTEHGECGWPARRILVLHSNPPGPGREKRTYALLIPSPLQRCNVFNGLTCRSRLGEALPRCSLCCSHIFT